MTEVDACSGTELVSSPTVSVSALGALRCLLDAQVARGEPSSADFDDPRCPRHPETCHESLTTVSAPELRLHPLGDPFA